MNKVPKKLLDEAEIAALNYEQITWVEWLDQQFAAIAGREAPRVEQMITDFGGVRAAINNAGHALIDGLRYGGEQLERRALRTISSNKQPFGDSEAEKNLDGEALLYSAKPTGAKIIDTNVYTRDIAAIKEGRIGAALPKIVRRELAPLSGDWGKLAQGIADLRTR